MTTVFPSFREQFQRAKFPFVDTATLKSDEGVELAESAFTDAMIHPVGGDETLHLSRIDVSSDQVVFWVGTRRNPLLASGTTSFPASGDTISLTDEYNRPAGVLVSDAVQLDAFFSWTPGTYNFSDRATRFCASCTTLLPDIGVQGFLLEDGTVISGHVYLYGEDGVVLSAGPDGCSIRVDVVGDPLFKQRACQEEQGIASNKKYVKTINGKPGRYGNFILTPAVSRDKPVLRFVPVDGGILVHAVGGRQQ